MKAPVPLRMHRVNLDVLRRNDLKRASEDAGPRSTALGWEAAVADQAVPRRPALFPAWLSGGASDALGDQKEGYKVKQTGYDQQIVVARDQSRVFQAAADDRSEQVDGKCGLRIR